MKVGILNLGLSNLFSIASSIKRLGAEVILLESLTYSVDAFIFPGVGNFTEGIRRVQSIRDALQSYIKSGQPFLGVCLGMQMLFERSEEGPGTGLRVFKGEVRRLQAAKVPHMGWNRINPVKPSPITEDIKPGEYVYFMHSYAPQPKDERIVLALTNYEVDFPSIIGEKSVFGTQFHPEKSGQTGEKILRNFLNLSKR
ncbi:MAG: imidazole glycerol phosphate synthase subunit HisH [Nitrososphaerota archaeon]|nr:imidazole glycerol phosphate synthase subunit HisH [Candidatus Calditenuaceae archaeon]MDW8073099.1 imidazole glycerol phosphate synthase subunit HisH [Nitrososphaerota archaeon]